MPGPHDLFARYTFGRPERAEAELRAALPAQVVSSVGWSTLRLESGSVVDPEPRETESDLLFTARLRTGRPLLLYVLLEHQSTVDRWMALRTARTWTRSAAGSTGPSRPLLSPRCWTAGLTPLGARTHETAWPVTPTS